MTARGHTALFLVIGLFVGYAYFYQAGGWNQNSRFALVRAIVEERTLRIDRTGRWNGQPVTGDFAGHDGHVYSDKAPGLALAAVPVVAAAEAFVPETGSRRGIAILSYVATLVTAALPTALTALGVFWIASMLGDANGGAAFGAVTFGLATPAWCYATLLFGHALSTSCLVGAFAAALALRERPTVTHHDLLFGSMVGLLGGWATITEYPTAVPAVITAVFALANVWPSGLARRGRVAIAMAATALACLAVLMSYNVAAFGSPLALGYSSVVGFEGMERGIFGVTYPKPWVLWEILFGRYRGLLPLSPVLAAAPIGFAYLIQRPGSRGPGVAATAIAVYYLFLNAAYVYWQGGRSYGPRHMSPALPFLCLALAPLWSRSRPFRVVLGSLAIYGGCLTLVAVSTTAQPPEEFGRPVTELLLPAFSRGDLSLNQQAFVELDLVRQRDPIAHAWNLGEKLGLSGHASLMPLFFSWCLVSFAWWTTRPAAPRATGKAPGAGTPFQPRRGVIGICF
jgi:hypothetical protein